MKNLQRILSFVRRAAEDYRMIDRDDIIAVGLSGGKDSLVLLTALAEMRRFYPVPYQVYAITVDMGFPGVDYRPLGEYCASLSVPFRLLPSDIAEIVFTRRAERNPCSLCSKLRRGILTAAAEELGCRKLALGHHLDDVAETVLMNLFFEGRFGCFSPVTTYDDRAVTIIRPLIYAKESDIVYTAKKQMLPILESTCPQNHITERENIKQLLRSLERSHPGIRHRIFGALCRSGTDGFREFPNR